MARTGRPPKPFDAKLLESHARNQSSELFTAEVMLLAKGENVNKQSLAKQVKLIQRHLEREWGMNYVQYREQKKEYRRAAISNKQFEVAMQGDKTMLIWLGKQYLDQREKSSHELSGPDGKPISSTTKIELSDEQLDEKIKILATKIGGLIE